MIEMNGHILFGTRCSDGRSLNQNQIELNQTLAVNATIGRIPIILNQNLFAHVESR
jgi:hypothetical protein